MQRIVGVLEMSRKRPAEVAPVVEQEKRKQVNIDADLVRKAGILASAQGMTVPDYVNNRLRPIIEAELAIVLGEMGFGPVGDGKSARQ